MHNCSTAHKGKTHRRRNRFLKKTLDPLHWWGVWGWGMDKAHESAIIDPVTNKPAKVRKDGTINSGDKRPSFVKTSEGKQVTSDKPEKTGRLVETAPATALSWLKKKVPIFGRM